ncbi:ComF family protein [Streptomyces sp. NPDC057837]|uniref:ComF family protein n=1 Tax=Streptomyces sp. NPDC057837 TaxID=3346260 RepID=UPI00368B0CD6
MRGWWQDLTDLVLPGECGGCGAPRAMLCAQCRAVLGGAAVRRVRPVPEPPGLPVVHAAAPYADEVRATLLAHKERGALALAGPLGAALARAVRAGLREGAARPGDAAAVREGVAPVLLVPVPSGRRAVRARGHDPARRIALAAAADLRRSGLPARVLGVLRQRRPVADQSGLNFRQRLDNLVGALTVAPGGARLLSAGPVVLVDDVLTTGASLAEAARALRAAADGPGGPHGLPAGPISNAARTAAVYGGESWESREEQNVGSRRERTGRRPGRRRIAGADGSRGAVDVVCAAVVAASPDAFQINRN